MKGTTRHGFDRHTAAVLVAAVFVCLLAGCGAALTPQPTPEAIIAPVTLTTPPPAQYTLPPTWTPTDTPSPEPPTATFTPSRTPTPEPTLSAAEVCEAFWYITNLETGTGRPNFLRTNGRFTLYASSASAGNPLRFEAARAGSDASRGIDMPGGTIAAVELLVSDVFPETGAYFWSLRVRSAVYGDLCLTEGVVLVVRPESTRPEERQER